MPESMPDPLHVPAGEHGVVRLFTLTIEAGDINALHAPGALDRALGVAGLDADQVEIFAIDDLAGVGLATYLNDGLGLPDAVVAPDADRLDALTGFVMVVLSRAFGGRAATLTPTAQLTLAGIWSQSPTNWAGHGHLASDSARGSTAPPAAASASPRAARARARRIGGAIFAVFMAIIAAIFLTMVF
jgi:hypothetical protein